MNDDYVVLPYKSVQPPLYYLAAGLVAQLAPPNPQTILYLGRLVSILFGAASVYFCWLAIRELAPEHLFGQSLRPARSRCSRNSVLPMRTLPMSAVNLAATAAFYV